MGGGNDLTRHKAWCLYRTQEAMTIFLSELTYPSEDGTSGTYIYLFAGMPALAPYQKVKARYGRAEDSMCKGTLHQLKTFKDTL
ncbi:hypothetical protein N9L68_04215 [bacterium]|nr:hypothetical protein [bacterium]